MSDFIDKYIKRNRRYIRKEDKVLRDIQKSCQALKSYKYYEVLKAIESSCDVHKHFKFLVKALSVKEQLSWFFRNLETDINDATRLRNIEDIDEQAHKLLKDVKWVTAKWQVDERLNKLMK